MSADLFFDRRIANGGGVSVCETRYNRNRPPASVVRPIDLRHFFPIRKKCPLRRGITLAI